jgi:predicted metal-dependent phosphoesterase TrpH
MHVHTNSSHDGVEPPSSLVERAREIGLDGLAITDHNSQEGVGEAMDAGRDNGLLVIPGVEVSCREGHVLLYGSEDFGVRGGMGVKEVLDVKGEFPGCISAPAHPFDLYRGGMGWGCLKHPFDAIETVNGHSLLPRGVLLTLARRLGVGEVGGSDTHFLRGLGSGVTVIGPGPDPLEEVRRSGRAEGGFDLPGLLIPRLKRKKGMEGQG